MTNNADMTAILTKRETFCLHMGVAKTGDDELDAIITEGNRSKACMHAIQGILSDNEYHAELSDARVAGCAVLQADELLAALEGNQQ
jgi:hypothetical protein